MNTVAGITIDRTPAGKPSYAHIDLRKHAEFIPLLEKKGLAVEVSVPIAGYQNPAETGIAPEGCVSVEDFFADIKLHINEFCDERSIY